MKLPSLRQVFQGALSTFYRFPLVLCSAVVGTVSGVILVDHEGPEVATVLFKILFASILGIPFLFALALTAEKRGWGYLGSMGIQAGGVVLLILYALTVPSTLSSGPAFHAQRLLVLAFAMHLFVSVGPFWGRGDQDGFWHYNKTLLFRLLGAALYTHILYLGLTLALAALDQLFGINIPGKRYGELWIITFGILNTWLFLAGVPRDLKSLEQSSEFPKSLRILVQYALAPLAVIYVVIIYAYVAKILFSWQWSDGWISKLILGFSTTGIVSVLFLYPLRETENAVWVRMWFRWFFVVMIPLVIVFPLALWRRIAEYGVTESRYAAVGLAAWLIIMVVYFLVSKTKNIKVIPASLGILSLVACFGPWNMFQVSEQSQIDRLGRLLERNSILAGGSVREAQAPVGREDSRNISTVLDYLHEVHGFGGIQQWFGENLKADSALARWKDPEVVAGIMGVDYVRAWGGGSGNFITFAMNPDVPLDVRGFDRLIRLQYVDRGRTRKESQQDRMTFDFTPELDTLVILSKEEGNRSGALRISLHQVAADLLAEYSGEGVGNVPPGKMTVSAAGEGISARVFLRSIQVRRRGEAVEISNISAEVAYSSRQP